MAARPALNTAGGRRRRCLGLADSFKLLPKLRGSCARRPPPIPLAAVLSGLGARVAQRSHLAALNLESTPGLEEFYRNLYSQIPRLGARRLRLQHPISGSGSRGG